MWTLRRDGATWSCELHYHGEWGVEAQLSRNGDLIGSRRFDMRATAIAWAEQERGSLSDPR
ncbi:MAG: hypothetical protein AB7F99_08270 [Vicinamibacterales bacterium]